MARLQRLMDRHSMNWTGSSMRRNLLALVAGALFLALAATGLAAHWPNFGGDGGRSGYQPVDEGGVPVVPFYPKAADSEKQIRTSIITTAGDTSDDPDFGQRMIYGTRGTAAGDRATIHHQVLFDGAAVNDNEPGVTIDGGAVDADSLSGGTDAAQPVGSVTPVESSGPDGLGITFALHNDDNQDGATNGANGSPDPRSGSDIAIAIISQRTGFVIRDKAVGPQDLPAAGSQINHTIGFTVSSSPVLGPFEDLDEDGDADDRALFFLAHRAGTDLAPAEFPCAPGINFETVPVAGPRGCGITSAVRLIRVKITDAGTNSATFDQATGVTAVQVIAASTVQTSSPALANLDPDADGVAEPYVVAATTDGFVRTYNAATLAPGPLSADLGGRVTTPSIPVQADGRMPDLAPKIIVAVDQSATPLQAQLFELKVASATSLAPEDTATDRSSIVPGRPASALAVTQLAGEEGGRVILGTGANLYSFDADDFSSVEFQNPLSNFAPGSTGYFNTVPAASAGLVYVANDRDDQMVLDELRLEPVAAEDFTPFSAEDGNEPGNGDGVGQPSISHGFVQFGSKDGAFVYRNQVGPAVELTAPADGAKVSGTVTLRAKASEIRSGVSSVVFKLNGVTAGVDTTPDSGDPFDAGDPGVYSVTIDSTRFGNGIFELVAEATDADVDADAPPETTESAPRIITVENPLTEQGPIYVSDAVALEGDQGTPGMTFFVTLPRAANGPVTVDYATADRTAKAPTDYTAASGKLTFAPGETSKTVVVSARGDVTREETEQFAVTLSGAAGAPIGDAEGIGTVVDDDAVPASPYALPPTLSLTVKPKRDKKAPFKFTSTGRLTLPSGVVAAKGCQGTVEITVKAVRKTISTRRAKVGKTCRFKKAVSFRSAKRFSKSGRLNFRARYLGTPYLKKTSSKTVKVRTTR